MEYIFIILALISVVTIIFVWVVFNKFVQQKNFIKEAWAAIDVCLKKRHDLVPNLISVVKSISEHEAKLYTEVSRWRASAMNSSTTKEREIAENKLSGLLGKINVVLENYPNLISGDNYLKLQDQLQEIENEIALARRYYNGTIRNNNILLESFPSNIIGKTFHFEKPDFFEIETSVEKKPHVLSF